MRISRGIIATAAFAAISLGQAHATVSGLDSTGSVVAGGIDQARTVNGGPAYAIADPGSVGWVGNAAGAQWISNVPDTEGGGGPFTYSTTFHASAGSNFIEGLMSADDQGSIYLNGILVFNRSS